MVFCKPIVLFVSSCLYLFVYFVLFEYFVHKKFGVDKREINIEYYNQIIKNHRYFSNIYRDVTRCKVNTLTINNFIEVSQSNNVLGNEILLRQIILCE